MATDKGTLYIPAFTTLGSATDTWARAKQPRTPTQSTQPTQSTPKPSGEDRPNEQAVGCIK
jgi:hypothetical protein